MPPSIGSAHPNGKQDDTLSLAIVGGGIAGLMLALSTARHSPHIPLTLYESAPKFGEIGAGVAFGPNAVRTMYKISPEVTRGFERVRTANQSDDRAGTYFCWRVGMDGGSAEARGKGVRAGEVVDTTKFTGVAAEWGHGMVHRAGFLDEMVNLVSETVRVEFGKRCVEYTDEGEAGVVLRFADGTEARHAAAVGCDGIKSRMRVLLLGDEDPAAYAEFTGKYCYRGLIPMEKAIAELGEAAAANSSMYHGYHGHFLTFPVQKGKTMNVVAFSSADNWDKDEWVVHADREKMNKDFEGWGPAPQKILQMMEKPDIWALFNHLPAKSYHNGSRMCLTGDAAHASTPHQGSGAGMAVEDAYVMSKTLQRVKTPADFVTAFAAFDRVRRPRTQRLVSTSKECGQLFDFEDPEVGDDLDKFKANLKTRHAWIWDHGKELTVCDLLASFSVG